MNLQTEIKWIQAELSKVTDPHLIKIFKHLLEYRKTQEDALTKELDLSLDRAFEDKDAGRVKSHKKIKEKYVKWL